MKDEALSTYYVDKSKTLKKQRIYKHCFISPCNSTLVELVDQHRYGGQPTVEGALSVVEGRGCEGQARFGKCCQSKWAEVFSRFLLSVRRFWQKQMAPEKDLCPRPQIDTQEYKYVKSVAGQEAHDLDCNLPVRLRCTGHAPVLECQDSLPSEAFSCWAQPL